MVRRPGVRRANVRSVVETVGRTVVLVGSALGHHLDLTTDRSREVGRLVEGRYLDFLNALDGGRHNTRGAATRLCTTRTGKVRYVAGIVASHVVGIISAIKHEYVLVRKCTRRHARRCRAGLQSCQRRD